MDLAALTADLKNPDHKIRNTAVQRCTRHNVTPEIARVLADWLMREETYWVDFNYEHLLKIGAPLVPALLEKINSTAEPGRWRGAVTLARLGEKRAGDVLARYLTNPPDGLARETQLVLPNLGQPQGNYDPDRLAAAILDDPAAVQNAAAWGLQWLADARALPKLLEIVRTGCDAQSLVSGIEFVLKNGAANANETDLWAALDLQPREQHRPYGDNSQFGPGCGTLDLSPLDFSRVHALASAELERREVLAKPDPSFISPTDCTVCRHIPDRATWGPGVSEPDPAPNLSMLQPYVELLTSTSALQYCPTCASGYEVSLEREGGFGSGATEVERIRRMTPTEARARLSGPARAAVDRVYARQLKHLSALLREPGARLREHAVRSVLDDHVVRSEWDAVGELLENADPLICWTACQALISDRDYSWELRGDLPAGIGAVQPMLRALLDKTPPRQLPIRDAIKKIRGEATA